MMISPKYKILFLLCCFITCASAQTLQQAQTMFKNKQYDKAAPVFLKYVKQQPANGNYNYWYGVCMLRTGKPAEAVKYLETSVQKRVTGGRLALGETYDLLYRFEEAVNCYEEYIADLSKRKQPTADAETLLEKSKGNLRMLKGVERVCVIDSFVVDKTNFLQTYKLSEESGKLYTHNQFFKTTGNADATVYETELGNKLYYAETGANKKLNIFQKNKLQDDWGAPHLLSDHINTGGNTNYPYVLTDGVTIYYASDGAESMGGYDIFVSRYNPSTDSYLTPENVGMPFNSPFNDYMYVIDEYNNLGWFASDRYQPEGKVCIYVFIPNSSKQTYNYESMKPQEIAALAKLSSLKSTWEDLDAARAAQQRLANASIYEPKKEVKADFEFVINNNHTYHQLSDFKSAQARTLFQQYQQKQTAYRQQTEKLDNLRQQYVGANQAKKNSLAPSILDLEKRIEQLAQEVDDAAIQARNTEIQSLK